MGTLVSLGAALGALVAVGSLVALGGFVSTPLRILVPFLCFLGTFGTLVGANGGVEAVGAAMDTMGAAAGDFGFLCVFRSSLRTLSSEVSMGSAMVEWTIAATKRRERIALLHLLSE